VRLVRDEYASDAERPQAVLALSPLADRQAAAAVVLDLDLDLDEASRLGRRRTIENDVDCLQILRLCILLLSGLPVDGPSGWYLASTCLIRRLAGSGGLPLATGLDVQGEHRLRRRPQAPALDLEPLPSQWAAGAGRRGLPC
jgi:hypothetical protein